LLEDRLLAVKSSRRWVWLTLDSGVLLRLSRQDRHYFPDWDWRGKIGRSLRVRGWLSNYDGKLQMRLRHPLMVEWQ
jgi:hypothetical protein